MIYLCEQITDLNTSNNMFYFLTDAVANWLWCEYGGVLNASRKFIIHMYNSFTSKRVWDNSGKVETLMLVCYGIRLELHRECTWHVANCGGGEGLCSSDSLTVCPMKKVILC